MTLSLREQIRQIGDNYSPEYSKRMNLPELVDALAQRAFVYMWKETSDTRAIRKAWLLLHVEKGEITSDTMAVE